MAAEIRSHDSYCENYQRMKKLPMCQRRNTDQKNIELWGSVVKEKNHTYFNNSKHVSLQHLNGTVLFDQSRENLKILSIQENILYL